MSLKSLAESMGLSKTTVSRALAGYQDVAPETRERVSLAVIGVLRTVGLYDHVDSTGAGRRSTCLAPGVSGGTRPRMPSRITSGRSNRSMKPSARSA